MLHTRVHFFARFVILTTNTMNKNTQLEDLSNDLFLDIFDYFHALDLFKAFSLLNQRLSSILSSTQLHIIVSKLHSHHQIKFLSSHLHAHAHQVISLSLQDQLRDVSSVIPFFFSEHKFINLRSCIFRSICPSSRLKQVIQQLQTLTKLESFIIRQSRDISLSYRTQQRLSKTILKHNLPKLRSIELSFRHNYSYLTANTIINWTLTSLSIKFHDATTNCSIYNILPIVHNYRVLRQLYVTISNSNRSNTYQTM